jgi:tetratricopeptide (TPR) repeat protein
MNVDLRKDDTMTTRATGATVAMRRSAVRRFADLSICVVLSLFLVPGCEATVEAEQSPAEAIARAEELYAEALHAMQAEDWRKAASLFKQGIAVGPYHEAARYTLGSLLLAHEPAADVVRYYRETVEHDPKPQTSQYFWARALAKSGDVEGAIDRYRRAIAIDSAHELSELGWGSVMEEQGKLEAALAHYERAAHIHPELTEALQKCARVLERLGRKGEAEAYLQRAATSDPNSPMRFLYWGRVLLEDGRAEAALAELEIAVEVMPQNSEARRLRDAARATLGK